MDGSLEHPAVHGEPPDPSSSSRFLRADLYANAVLLASAVIVALPVLRGGYLTYADNPVHLAELFSLAFEAHRGWSDIGFLGFPLAALHSPFWYGALASLTRIGVAAEPLYATMLLLGFAAPAFALYRVARRSSSPAAAVLPAYLLLLQRPAIVGLGSALGGMWTFYLAAAALILLADRLAHGRNTFRRAACIAGLCGLIGLTHLFALVPLCLLFFWHSLRRLLGGSEGERALLPELGAGLLGALASALYWLPAAASLGQTPFTPQHLEIPRLLRRLVLPTDVLVLLGAGSTLPPLSWARLLVESLPMFALVGLGVAGVYFRVRNGESRQYGLPMAGLMLAAIVLATVTGSTALGPLSWRMLYFVRVGLALAAIATCGMLALHAPRWLRRRRAAWIGAAGALGLAFLSSAPLGAVVADRAGPEMTEVRELWRWLRDHRRDDWGRVYLQDTFMTPPLDRMLRFSHVLALSAREAGVHQLGPYYGVVPYPTGRWTAGEFGRLFAGRVVSSRDLRQLMVAMERSNATHLVVSDPVLAARLRGTPVFTSLARVGRFEVLQEDRYASSWAVAAEGDATLERIQAGHLRLRLTQPERAAPVLLKIAYHPSWRAAPGAHADLAPEPDGLMRIENLSARGGTLDLLYRAPVLPRWLSGVGWIAVLGLASWPAVRREWCCRRGQGKRRPGHSR